MSLKIKTIMCNPLQENCHIVSDESGECVIIDCGALYSGEVKAITDYVSSNKLTPVHLLATHGHFDHNFGVSYMEKEYGLKLELPSLDAAMVGKIAQQVKEFMGVSMPMPAIVPSRLLNDGDTIAFGSHVIEVIHTPGHTPGSSCLYIKSDGVLFSGDTLFRMSIGRTDLEGGSHEHMIASLSRLAELPSDTEVYTGHGPETNIGEEKTYNPYMV